MGIWAWTSGRRRREAGRARAAALNICKGGRGEGEEEEEACGGRKKGRSAGDWVLTGVWLWSFCYGDDGAAAGVGGFGPRHTSDMAWHRQVTHRSGSVPRRAPLVRSAHLDAPRTKCQPSSVQAMAMRCEGQSRCPPSITARVFRHSFPRSPPQAAARKPEAVSSARQRIGVGATAEDLARPQREPWGSATRTSGGSAQALPSSTPTGCLVRIVGPGAARVPRRAGWRPPHVSTTPDRHEELS